MMATTHQILAALAAAASQAGGTLPLAPSVYPEMAIRVAVESFSHLCIFEECSKTKGVVGLRVRVQPDHLQAAHQIIGELQNFLLRAAVEGREALSAAR